MAVASKQSNLDGGEGRDLHRDGDQKQARRESRRKGAEHSDRRRAGCIRGGDELQRLAPVRPAGQPEQQPGPDDRCRPDRRDGFRWNVEEAPEQRAERERDDACSRAVRGVDAQTATRGELCPRHACEPNAVYAVAPLRTASGSGASATNSRP
jgi:hypothetical protein